VRHNNAARGRTDVPKIVDGYMQGKMQIDPMIAHVMPLADINKAFDLMKQGESIRSVMTFQPDRNPQKRSSSAQADDPVFPDCQL
jgi:hypothetical protein